MKKSNKISALNEIEGIHKPIQQKVKRSVKEEISVKEYVKKIRACDISILSRAITLVESSLPKHQEVALQIVNSCLPFSGKSIRIGITGVPGVGKSTFIEALGNHLTSIGNKVAILAVDPSSSLNKGSILGDKTRMETLVQNTNVYIRPSASGTTLGGVAKKTRESILLCEAAGFDIILIETVGVGQSETAVHSMVDFFLLLKLAGAGDELQGIKRGIIEMADTIVINKADGENIQPAKLAKIAFENALHLYPLNSNAWQPRVLLASALNNIGIIEVWNLIDDFVKHSKEHNSFETKRQKQEEFWLFDTLNEQLKLQFYSNPKIKQALKEQLQLIQKKKTTPYEVASLLLKLYGVES
ncbi:MAG TPA: methylmalonyl Co-A mutase-associated GTPase MeaB [Lutibacter sp.]|nr:methylmalonyl Co-A mutase-associated GTPase MeaB [Lutibacter sp.]